jgi:hypothetical protein
MVELEGFVPLLREAVRRSRCNFFETEPGAASYIMGEILHVDGGYIAG